MSRSWYVLRTRPRSEGVAAAALEREGMELFLPRVRRPDADAGGASAPLFPGYIFLRQDMEGKRLPPLDRFPGVLGWVEFDGVVPTVPDEVIADLARRVEAINHGGGLWARFQAGQRVRVVSEHMDVLARVLEEPRSPQARVRVLLEFMGRLVSAQVPWASLQPVQSDAGLPAQAHKARRTRGRGRWTKGFGPRAVASA